MPLKKEANDLLNNRFFQLLKSEFEADYFERWLDENTVEGREDIWRELTAYKAIVARIEHEAERYEPVKVA